MNLFLKILASVLAVEILGGLGAFVTMQSIPGWYAELVKPPGTPPNSVFGPVWTTLYAMIGIAFALVWHSGNNGDGKKRALAWFAMQLILNLAWTPVFFGWHQVGAALVIILCLGAAIVVTIRSFARISLPAAWLLVPYLLWVGYATYLNAGFLVLNRS